MPPGIEIIVNIPQYRSSFRSWLIDQIRMRYPKSLLPLRFRETLFFKGKGLRRSAIDILSISNRYDFFPIHFTF